MNTKPTLTVFTCTYNRAHTIGRTYESLCRQTCKDFIWLVVDDGSIDNTGELVKQWQIKDNDFEIQYTYKENGGLHTGYNKAIELMDTELCVCIDSDDWMPDNAVEIIINSWKRYGNVNLAGIVGYDCLSNGQVLGDNFTEGKVVHYIKLKESRKYNIDNKIVMRVDLLKKVAPQPSFPNEKNFNPIWLILKIDEMVPFVLINKNLCIVDYQDGGMSYNLINQYFNSPNSILELRKLYISLKFASSLYKLKNYIHLIAQSFIARKNPFVESPSKLITCLFLPIGYMLYIYMCASHIRFNKNRSVQQ